MGFSMKFAIPMCWFNRHAPKRDRVKWDGLNFIGHCRHCGAHIRRHPHGGWAKEWMETV
jgi:hypothetical protein